MRSWQEFVDRAAAPATGPWGRSRMDRTEWAGAGWLEALRLARDGWTERVPEAELAVAGLHDRTRREVLTAGLHRVAGVSGSEVDVAAYLAGVPECMADTEMRQVSTHGRVVAFLVPATYSCAVDRTAIVHRGMALCALCAAVVGAGHSVEVWSGYASGIPGGHGRYHAVANVISPGEPFDPARLLFATAHPAMLRRLWFGVWDSAPPEIARLMGCGGYGEPPYDCRLSDLPDDVTDAYVFPHLAEEPRWRTWDTALAWSLATFRDLGLLDGSGSA